ncbi:MAG TPA: polyribonucleotide nucleotidyltransferase [Dehalococcoidia bacterium]|nr:polyribonucleotide nucleotidyltransferase [Dehalococcoidia bacterium]
MSQISEIVVGGKSLIIETGRLAAQANGSITVALGETVVLVTACASPEPRPDIDFFPLTIDFEERLYAIGKIPGSFPRREGRPSTDAVLAGRMTDRALRPLFPKGFRNDVQIIITTLSADMENDPDVLATIGASAALTISDIPFDGPVSAMRVGHIGDEYILYPTYAQLDESDLDLVVSSTSEKVIMVEAGASGVSEEVFLEAVRRAHEANQILIKTQQEMAKELGKPKITVETKTTNPEAEAAVADLLKDRLEDVLGSVKEERAEGMRARRDELKTHFGDKFSNDDLAAALDAFVKKTVRGRILTEGKRADGRDLDELRPITCDVGILPRTHGTGLFQRGETQVLSIVTLGPLSAKQKLDTLSPEETKRFMHHYNFPPFSVGEVRRLGTGRRELGHGALGERALEYVVPPETEFPYTIRIVSEVLGSNGSTSQASICASSLALMDAGVPIKEPVAGVAMGLVTAAEGDDYRILTDIAGLEDALGDMDFKVAGTANGITAVQADFKVKGISVPMIEDIVAKAKTARLVILGKLAEAIDTPRKELSRYAPRVYRILIPREKIGAVIGPGGKMVRSIIEETKCTVDVEDDGSVYVGSTNEENARKAIAIIEGLTREAVVGQVYTGRVTRTVDFGAFVEIMPGKEGLVRIGELADYRVPTVEDVVQVGDEIQVMVMEIDNLGRINLSRRAVLEGTSPEELEEPAPGEIPSPLTRRSSMLTTMRPPQRAPRQDGGGGGGFRRGGRGRGGSGGSGGGRPPGGGPNGGGGRRPPAPRG